MIDVQDDLLPIIRELESSGDPNDIAMAGLLIASLAAHLSRNAVAALQHQTPWIIRCKVSLEAKSANSGTEIINEEAPNA